MKDYIPIILALILGVALSVLVKSAYALTPDTERIIKHIDFWGALIVIYVTYHGMRKK